MPAVQVRNLPQETYDQLKALAQENGRSITKQTEAILIDFFAARPAYQSPEATPSAPMATMFQPNPFHRESPAEIQERAARRAALFAEIDSREAFDPPKDWDPATVVRQMRDER
ncbi:MAG: hypothetical protein Q4D06_01270 [Coriobacteriia bacterium]|nr:hypothetical protein [Coriobacteriia bacterium]